MVDWNDVEHWGGHVHYGTSGVASKRHEDDGGES